MIGRRAIRLAPVLALASLLVASEARAQFGAVGVKGGANWTSLSGDLPSEGGSGFIGGVFAYGQSGAVVAQFEVLLSKRGVATPSGELRESFIQVPVLFGARGGSGTLNAILYGGPSISFKSSCTVTGPTGLEENCRAAGFVEKGTLWSVMLGLALDYRINRVVLILDGRYDSGLTNAFDNFDGKWRSWALMAGIGFIMPT